MFRMVCQNAFINEILDRSKLDNENPFSLTRYFEATIWCPYQRLHTRFNLFFCEFFNFGFINTNLLSFCSFRLLGVHPSIKGTFWDVALLAMLFLHRYKLMRLGMYDDDFRSQQEEINLESSPHTSDTDVTVRESLSMTRICLSL